MIDWNGIEHVFLDMDGTLLDLYFDNRFWQHHVPKYWSKQNNMALEHANKHISDLTDQHRGQLNWYCLDFWSEQLAFDVQALKFELRDQIAWREGSVAFLNWLANQGVTLMLVTNAHPKTLEVKFQQLPLSSYFSTVISSHQYAAPKESQLFWQRFMEQHPFDPATTLFIDDSEAVLESAKKFGIRHLLSIASPDSSIQQQRTSQFRMIQAWQELMNSHG